MVEITQSDEGYADEFKEFMRRYNKLNPEQRTVIRALLDVCAAPPPETDKAAKRQRARTGAR